MVVSISVSRRQPSFRKLQSRPYSRLAQWAIPALMLAACSDHGGNSGPDALAPNVLPIANAGADNAVNEAVRAILDGSASVDSDGAVVSYAWRQTDGPTVVLTDAHAPRSSFTAPAVTAQRALAFRLTVTDDRGDSASDDVNVVVNPMNLPPSATDDATSTTEDNPVMVAVLANDSDPDDSAEADDPAQIDPATVTVGDVVGGAATANPNGTVGFTPIANFNGAASFRYTVKDISGATSNAATASINVTSVNDSPVISDIADRAINEDTSTGVIAFTVDDADIGAGALSVSAISGNASIVPPGGLVLGGSGANRTLTGTPAANASGPVTITVTVSDGGNSTSDSFVLTVRPVNDAPVADSATATTLEDTAKSGTATARDADGDALTFSADGAPVGGAVVVGTSGAWSFTPSANFNGPASFDFRACDGVGACGSGTVSITVTPDNDAPVASAGSAITTEDTPVSGTLDATDVDGDTLTFSKSGAETGGTGSVVGRGYTFTPAANFNGPASFGFRACDPAPLCSTAVVSITVGAVNDAPTISDVGDQTTAEDTAKGPLNFTISDVETAATALTLSATSSDTGVVADTGISFGGSGGSRTVTVSPVVNASGSASITITVSDGSASSSGSFVLTVTPVNDAPIAQAASFNGVEDEVVAGRLTASDADGDPLTFSISTAAQQGSIDLAASGAFTYTPNSNFNGKDRFKFRVSDGQGSVEASVEITVAAVNDPPIAVDDSATSLTDEPVTIEVLANDGDVDGNIDPASVTVSGVTQGTTVIDKGTGAITFTPMKDTSGEVSFFYRVSDSAGLSSAPAKVNIQYAAVLFKPSVVVAVADSGVNPYHKVYYRPEMTQHPCTYVEGYDCGIPALELSIGEYDTWQEAYEADRELWASVTLHKWYWIPKTNIIGAVCHSPLGGGAVAQAINTVAPKLICILDDSSNHGTGTSSAVLMEGPDSLLLIHEGDSTAADLLTAPVRPDIQSHSWGPPVPLPLHAFGMAVDDSDNCGFGQVGPETLFFQAAGNEALWPAPADQSRFCPSSINVGGGTSDSGEVGSWSLYDFASWYCRPGALTKSLDGYGEYCGTSFSAPTAAGTAAAALLEIRRAQGYTGRNTGDMVSTSVTRKQFINALQMAASYDPEETYPNGNGYAPLLLIPGQEYLVWGWGFLDRQVVPDVVSCVLGPVCPQKRPEAVQWNEARHKVREEIWATGSGGAP